jgi:hypothetical protein
MIGDCNPEGLGGRKIHRMLELRGLLERDIPGLCSTQNFVDHGGGAREQVPADDR